jgi:hypothetical protein
MFLVTVGAVLVLFGPQLLCLLSAVGSVVHFLDEVDGDPRPLWEEFGRVAGVWVPALPGLAAFAGLAAATLALAAGGYWCGSGWALSLLLGARVGDLLFSHVGLRALAGSDPNPGFWTAVVFYGSEVVLALLFLPDTLTPAWVAVGVWAFALPIPTLCLLGRVGVLTRSRSSR